jgi:hypothetical protein
MEMQVWDIIEEVTRPGNIADIACDEKSKYTAAKFAL